MFLVKMSVSRPICTCLRQYRYVRLGIKSCFDGAKKNRYALLICLHIGTNVYVLHSYNTPFRSKSLHLMKWPYFWIISCYFIFPQYKWKNSLPSKGKFWSDWLCHFINHKLLIYEEWSTYLPGKEFITLFHNLW